MLVHFLLNQAAQIYYKKISKIVEKIGKLTDTIMIQLRDLDYIDIAHNLQIILQRCHKLSLSHRHDHSQALFKTFNRSALYLYQKFNSLYKRFRSNQLHKDYNARRYHFILIKKPHFVLYRKVASYTMLEGIILYKKILIKDSLVREYW